MGAEEMPAGDAGAAEPAAEETPLLAVPPGSRDQKHLSTYEKSNYVRKDGTNDGRKTSGRGKNMRSHGNKAMAGHSKRAKFPGSRDLTTSTIPSIAKGIYEQEESTYTLKESKEEQKLFEVNDSLKQLIGSLEHKQGIITEQDDEK
jgi:hypothetical protein